MPRGGRLAELDDARSCRPGGSTTDLAFLAAASWFSRCAPRRVLRDFGHGFRYISAILGLCALQTLFFLVLLRCDVRCAVGSDGVGEELESGGVELVEDGLADREVVLVLAHHVCRAWSVGVAAEEPPPSLPEPS